MVLLTLYFDSPFWVGVFEHSENGKIETCRVVFGREPKDYEVYEFILKHYYELRFSKPIEAKKQGFKRINPKRMHRKISKEMRKNGVSTKAQEAMRIEREARKVERKHISHEQKEEYKKAQFKLKQAKKKDKKKGH
jgi:hypothetical protein